MNAKVDLLFHAYGWINSTRPIKRSIWPHFDLFFLHSGTLRMQIARRTAMLRGPQGVLIFPHTHFEGEAIDEVCRASVQHFRIHETKRSELPSPFKRITAKKRGFELFTPARSQRHETDVHRAIAMSESQSAPHLHDMRVALLCLLLGELAFETTRSASHPGQPLPEPFVELQAWLWQDLACSISVHDMAAQARMSFSAFRTNFRRLVGISPARYLRDARMREAQRLLRETDHSIKRIARLVGYEELPHLYRAFRAHFAVPPAAYRAEVRRFS